MLPSIETALTELKKAGELNPGLWIKHSENVAAAAKIIADNCKNLDGNKAYILGLLHDIGRRTGIYAMRHIIDGYDYSVSR